MGLMRDDLRGEGKIPMRREIRELRKLWKIFC